MTNPKRALMIGRKESWRKRGTHDWYSMTICDLVVAIKVSLKQVLAAFTTSECLILDNLSGCLNPSGILGVGYLSG